MARDLTNLKKGRPGMGWMPVLLVVALLAAAAGGAWWVWRPRAVATVAVERGNVVRAFYATGTVRPDYEYVLKAKGQGALVELNTREGRLVRKGDLLARVDDKQLRQAAERAKAELREAQAQAGEASPERRELEARLAEAKEQYAIADRQLKRLENLFAQGSSSVTDLDTARRTHVQWFQAMAALESKLGTWKIESVKRVEVAQADVRKAEADLADTEVKSPIDGIVLERYVEQDEVVSLNQKLFLVARPEDMLMKAAVDEEDIAHTFEGQLVQMQLYAFSDTDRDLNARKQVFQGHVKEILPTANPVNKTFEVKVAFDAPPAQLRVGMTAELNFIIDAPGLNTAERGGMEDPAAARPAGLVVPSTAVMDGKVYRVREGKYEAVDVKVGVRSLERVEVTGDLAEGDRVVADAKQVAPVVLPKNKGPVVPTRAGDKVQ